MIFWSGPKHSEFSSHGSIPKLCSDKCELPKHFVFIFFIQVFTLDTSRLGTLLLVFRVIDQDDLNWSHHPKSCHGTLAPLQKAGKCSCLANNVLPWEACEPYWNCWYLGNVIRRCKFDLDGLSIVSTVRQGIVHCHCLMIYVCLRPVPRRRKCLVRRLFSPAPSSVPCLSLQAW